MVNLSCVEGNRAREGMDLRRVQEEIGQGIYELVAHPGRSQCWDLFRKVRMASTGLELFGVACCSRCHKCLMYRARGADGKAKDYGTKNLIDHMKSCGVSKPRAARGTPLLKQQLDTDQYLVTKRFLDNGLGRNILSTSWTEFENAGSLQWPDASGSREAGTDSQTPAASADERSEQTQVHHVTIKEEVQLVPQASPPRTPDPHPSTSLPNIAAVWSIPRSPTASTSQESGGNPTSCVDAAAPTTSMCLSPQLQFGDSADDELSRSQKEHSLRMELLVYQLETAQQQRDMAQKEHDANMTLVWRKIEMVEVQKQWMQMQMDKLKHDPGMTMPEFEDPTHQSTALPD